MGNKGVQQTKTLEGDFFMQGKRVVDPHTVRLAYPFEEYLVESSGAVYSEKRKKYLTPFIDSDGYNIIRFRDKQGRLCQRNLARLVAYNFLPKPRRGNNTLMYKDHDRSNCSVSNLRWVTRTYSLRYQRQLTVREEYNTPDMKVRVITLGNVNLPTPVGTIAEAAEKYGLLYYEVEMSARDRTPCLSAPKYSFEWEYSHNPNY